MGGVTTRGAALAFTTFVSGAVLLGLELAASRVLAPAFGNSLFVWGALIGVVLSGLAIGYWTGGVLADRWPSPRLLVGAVFIGGLLVLAVPLVDERVLDWVERWDPGPRADPLIAAIILFGPPSVVLATVTPIAVRIASRELHTVGRTAGRLFSISTIGSIAGTFATAFWLIPELGVDQLIAVGATVLLLAALPLAIADRAWLLAGGGAALAAVAVAAAIALAPDRDGTVSAVETRNYSPIVRSREDLYENAYEPSVAGFQLRDRRDTRYHHLLVMDSDGIRYLRFDSSFQSAMRLARPYEGYFDYTNALQVALGYRRSARDMLFIGLGGGSAPKRIHRDFPEIRMRMVEIDPEVVDVARKWFAFPRSIPVDVEDGRRYLERHDKRYDVIVIDAYYADAVPFHLTTREFLEITRDRLKPGGVVVSNVIGAIKGDGSKLLRSFVRTYREVFPTVVLHPVYTSGEDFFATANIILVASTGAAPDVDALRARWRAVRAQHPTAPDLNRLIGGRVDAVPTNDVPTLVDDYAPTDALLVE
jgi:spermidine synthase